MSGLVALRLAVALAALCPAVALAAAADTPRVYRERCAVCHGASGRGDGPAAGLLSPRPRFLDRSGARAGDAG